MPREPSAGTRNECAAQAKSSAVTRKEICRESRAPGLESKRQREQGVAPLLNNKYAATATRQACAADANRREEGSTLDAKPNPPFQWSAVTPVSHD